MAKKLEPVEQDSAWKDILEDLFPQFLEFFFPEVYRDVDFSKGFEFLDKELSKILKGSQTGTRIVDKLVKVFLKNGGEKWLLIHVEIQGQPEKDFERRIYVYNYRIADKFNKDVVSLVILTDDNVNFRPEQYRSAHWRFEIIFKFPAIKLIDYDKDWHALEKNENPFAIAVQAFLKTLATKGDDQTRFSWKKRLLIELYARGLTKKTVLALYRFIDWVMTLPKELEDVVMDELTRIEENKKMPYVTYAERRGMKRGMERGKEKGMEEGWIKGLHASINDILEIKFGDASTALIENIQSVNDVRTLESLRDSLKHASSLLEAKKFVKDALAKKKVEAESPIS